MNTELRQLRRLEAFNEQNGRCFYCKHRMTLEIPADNRLHRRTCTLEHLVNIVDGGDNSRENTVAACHDCNNKLSSLVKNT